MPKRMKRLRYALTDGLAVVVVGCGVTAITSFGLWIGGFTWFHGLYVLSGCICMISLALFWLLESR